MRERSQRSRVWNSPAPMRHRAELNRPGEMGLIIFYEDFVLVDFDDAGTLVCHHLLEDLVDNAFVHEAGKPINFFYLLGIDKITGFVDESDADVLG